MTASFEVLFFGWSYFSWLAERINVSGSFFYQVLISAQCNILKIFQSFSKGFLNLFLKLLQNDE